MSKRIKPKRIRFCDSQVRTIFSALIVDYEWFSYIYRHSDQSSFVQTKSSYFKKYEPITDVDTEKLSTFSRISFKKFDQVQQRRFYQLSYPVIRRKLCLSSKQTSYLGPKPHFMITNSVKGIWKENSAEAEDPDDPLVILKEQFLKNEISNFANIVLSFGHSAIFSNLNSVDFWELTKYVEFSQTDIAFFDSDIDNLELSIICHPKTRKLHSVWADIDFEYALNLLPQLKELSIEDHLVVGWENHILKWNIQSLERLQVRADSITEFESLKKIALKMPPGSKLAIAHASNFDEEKLLMHFEADKSTTSATLFIEEQCYKPIQCSTSC